MVNDVAVRFVVMVEAVSAEGLASCSVGVSLTVRDVLRTSKRAVEAAWPQAPCQARVRFRGRAVVTSRSSLVAERAR